MLHIIEELGLPNIFAKFSAYTYIIDLTSVCDFNR